MSDCEKCGRYPATKGPFCRSCYEGMYGADPHLTWEQYLSNVLKNRNTITSITKADEELLLYQYYLWETEHGKPQVCPNLRNYGSYRSEYEQLEAWFRDAFFDLLNRRCGDQNGGTRITDADLERSFIQFFESLNRLLIGLISEMEYFGNADRDRVLMLFKKVLRLQNVDPSFVDDIGSAFIPGSALFFMEIYASLGDSRYLNGFQSAVQKLGRDEALDLMTMPMVLPVEWDHQLEAFRAWAGNDHNGIVEMATGTGKTLVGLMAMAELYRKRKGKGKVLVLGPSKAILNQWRREVVDKLGIMDDRDAEYTRPVTVGKFSVSFMTLQSVYKEPSNYPANLLIVDEVHHSAAKALRNALAVPARWKMGLSATVEGEVRENILTNELGRIVYNFPLREAMERNVLPSFEWKLHPTFLSVEEDEEFSRLSRAIIRDFVHVKDDQKTVRKITKEDFELKDLHDFTRLMEIARYHRVELPAEWKRLQVHILRRRWIVHKSKPKMENAIELAKCYAKTNKVIIFAMDTDSCDHIAEQLRKDVDNVFVAHSKIKGSASEEIFRFRDVKAGVLIGARMLDEGIDIPDADVGISIASSKTRLQLVQRMGRILRNRPGKKPVFHHYIALPEESRCVADEDDLQYIDDLSWMQETAHKLGLHAELVEEEAELRNMRLRAEMLISRRITGNQHINLPTYGTLRVGGIMSMLSSEARDKLIAQLLLMDASSKVTDQQWAALIRSALGKKENEPFNWPGNWYLLVAANRDPRKIVSLLA